MPPLAYHITWGTYGTRLHGDPRGTVDRDWNEYGTPVYPSDPPRWQQENHDLKHPRVELTQVQIHFLESHIPQICARGFWCHLESAAAPDHVHVVLHSTQPPTPIRHLLKRWTGQALTQHWPRPQGATWWSEGGSIKWIHDHPYLANATRYVRDQRATPPLHHPPDLSDINLNLE